jgi:hypothetical protein
MKRSILCLAAVVLLGFLTQPVLAAETKAKSHKPFQIQFLAGRQDSAEFALMQGLAQIVNTHSSWLRN